MCGGMTYTSIDPITGEVKTRTVYFPIPQAKIPVLPVDGDSSEPQEPQFCQWGKRRGEDDAFDVPVTGWARLLSLKEGKWNRYNPSRVVIPALRWMEKDPQRQTHWFELQPGRAILGVRLEVQGKAFVYVVTRPAAGDMADVHDRMPLVVPIDHKAKTPHKL
jgi:putative SOS response-associated peptidase YedK